MLDPLYWFSPGWVERGSKFKLKGSRLVPRLDNFKSVLSMLQTATCMYPVLGGEDVVNVLERRRRAAWTPRSQQLGLENIMSSGTNELRKTVTAPGRPARHLPQSERGPGRRTTPPPSWTSPTVG